MWEAGGGLTPMEALFQLGPGVGRTRTQLWPYGWIPCAGSRMVWSSGRCQVGRTGVIRAQWKVDTMSGSSHMSQEGVIRDRAETQG